MDFKIKQPKTWIIDIDGTLLIHNGYKNNKDNIIEKSKRFIESLSNKDIIILTTARELKYKKQTIDFLKINNIRFNHIIFGLPTGERILINDKKIDGTKTAYAINLIRNKGIEI